MKSTFVIDMLKDAFSMEIANHFTTTETAIIINFPDRTSAIIQAIKVKSSNGCQKQFATTNNKHTYHYIHQHDNELKFNPQNKPFGKFELISIEDCRSYLDDACHTFFDAKFRDFELEFNTGNRYLITLNKYIKN